MGAGARDSGIIFFIMIPMHKDISLQKLAHILATHTASIRYRPLAGEVDYTSCELLVPVLEQSTLVPNTSGTDPLLWAAFYTSHYRNSAPCILIPGNRFDMKGARYGRGMGWYDRFLTAIPPNWLRIGIANQTQLSPTPLVRQPWDEPVDWIIVRDGSSWKVYETRARHL